MLAVINEPILVGLQAPNGEWLSVAGGWCDDGRATLLFQMNNDREYHRDSVSQVLRSYLIEELIAGAPTISSSGLVPLHLWRDTQNAFPLWPCILIHAIQVGVLFEGLYPQLRLVFQHAGESSGIG